MFVEIKQLAYEEVQQFVELQQDRKTREYYQLINDDLQVITPQQETPSKNIEQHLLLLQDIHLHGGYIIGAFVGRTMVGFAALDCQYISGFRLRLAELIVAEKQQETAQALLLQIKKYACALEAEAIYICSTAEKSMVDFYLQQGARLAKKPDAYLKQLYEAEIHLELAL